MLNQYADYFRMVMAGILTIASLGLLVSEPVFGINVPTEHVNVLLGLLTLYGGTDFLSARKANNGGK